MVFQPGYHYQDKEKGVKANRRTMDEIALVLGHNNR